jgi:hypothetical protein
MNNDSIPIEASASTTNPRPNTSNHDPPSDGVAAAAPTPAAIQSPAQERAKSRMKKRSEFLGDLMNKLDMAIYMELCVLYYMEYVYPPSLLAHAHLLMITAPAALSSAFSCASYHSGSLSPPNRYLYPNTARIWAGSSYPTSSASCYTYSARGPRLGNPCASTSTEG